MAFPARELACLPVATNDAQQLFMNAFTLPVLVWIPVAVIALAAVRVLRNFVLSGATVLPQGLRVPWRRRRDAPTTLSAAALGARQLGAESGVHTLVHDASQRVIVEFFGRLLLVIALM
jgi:hypothetical protein